MRPQRIEIDIESLSPITSSTTSTSSDEIFPFLNNSPIRRRQPIISAHEVPPMVQIRNAERYIDNEEDTEDTEDTLYESEYDDEIPVYNFIFTPLKSFIILVLFIKNANDVQSLDNGYSTYPDLLTYSVNNYPECQDKRYEIWRLISNSFIHSDLSHVMSNLIIFLYSGYLLEYNIGFFKTMIVFVSSTLIGNLTILNLNPYITIIGCSHSVFGIIGSNLSNTIINYDIMTFSEIYLYLFSVLLFVSIEILSYFLNYSENIGYIGHWSGFLNGFLISFLIIEQYKKTNFKYWLSIFFIQSLIWIYIVLFYNYFNVWPKTDVYNEQFIKDENYNNCCLNFYKELENDKTLEPKNIICNIDYEKKSIINI